MAFLLASETLLVNFSALLSCCARRHVLLNALVMESSDQLVLCHMISVVGNVLHWLSCVLRHVQEHNLVQ